MSIFEFVELCVHRGNNIGMRVPKTGNRRATGCVYVFFSGSIADGDAIRAFRDRVMVVDLPVQDVGQDRLIRFFVVKT